mgnify:CR=1 FL=1
MCHFFIFYNICKIKFKAESKRLLDLMINSIYTNKAESKRKYKFACDDENESRTVFKF